MCAWKVTCRASLCLWDFVLPSVPPLPVYTCERQRKSSTTTVIMCLRGEGNKETQGKRDKRGTEVWRYSYTKSYERVSVVVSTELESVYLLCEKTSSATEGATSSGSKARSWWISCWAPRVRDRNDSWREKQPCWFTNSVHTHTGSGTGGHAGVLRSKARSNK